MDAKAGIVLVTKFVSGSSKIFSSYVDYIDRDEAIRNQHFSEFSAFDEYVGSYMADEEKTQGLFTADRDELDDTAKESLKDIYKTAQRNGSLMWQTVISFDNDFLAKNGLFDTVTGKLEDDKLREYTRKSMGVILEKENLSDAVWSASIHYNTDNIHVHVATVQPKPSWAEDMGRCRSTHGRLYQRGKFQQRNIDAGKSAFANSIARDQIDNSKINEIKRSRILELSKSVSLKSEKEKNLQRKFIKLAESLPDDLRLLKYGNNAMKAYRPQIDEITNDIIEKYCADDFRELSKLLNEADSVYQGIYGESKNRKFSDTHYQDLRQRMGNIVLNQAIEYKKDVRIKQWQEAARYKRAAMLKNELLKSRLAQARISAAASGIRRSLKEDAKTIQNEAAYQRLMQETER